jgi:hypothetical protein
MGLQFPKKKTAATVTMPAPALVEHPAAPELSGIAAEIDAYGTLLAEAGPILAKIKELQNTLKPLKEAETALHAAIDEFDFKDDIEDHLERGEKFMVAIGPRGSKRSVKDMALVKATLGQKLFMEIASVTLKDLDAYMTPPQLALVLKTERTTHSIKVTKRVG